MYGNQFWQVLPQRFWRLHFFLLYFLLQISLSGMDYSYNIHVTHEVKKIESAQKFMQVGINNYHYYLLPYAV